MTEFETKLDNLRERYRENLRKVFPEISRLESLTELEGLQVKRCVDDAGILVVEYKAYSEAYPNIRRLLLDKGIAKKHNIRYGGRMHPDDLIGHPADDILGETYRKHCQYETQLLYYGSKLQIFLEVWPIGLKDKK